MIWLYMFFSRFLINIKGQDAGLSWEVPPSDHQRVHNIPYAGGGDVNICLYFSLLTKNAMSYVKHHNEQCKCLCYFKTTERPSMRWCWNEAWRGAYLKTYYLQNLGQRHLPEVWTMRMKQQLQHLGERHNRRPERRKRAFVYPQFECVAIIL